LSYHQHLPFLFSTIILYPKLQHTYQYLFNTNTLSLYGIKVRCCCWDLSGEHDMKLGSLCFDFPHWKKTKKKKKGLHRKSTVNCPSGKWTVSLSPDSGRTLLPITTRHADHVQKLLCLLLATGVAPSCYRIFYFREPP
jgi:hypothetical protein